jgi:hypothetical protein
MAPSSKPNQTNLARLLSDLEMAEILDLTGLRKQGSAIRRLMEEAPQQRPTGARTAQLPLSSRAAVSTLRTSSRRSTSTPRGGRQRSRECS